MICFPLIACLVLLSFVFDLVLWRQFANPFWQPDVTLSEQSVKFIVRAYPKDSNVRAMAILSIFQKFLCLLEDPKVPCSLTNEYVCTLLLNPNHVPLRDFPLADLALFGFHLHVFYPSKEEATKFWQIVIPQSIFERGLEDRRAYLVRVAEQHIPFILPIHITSSKVKWSTSLHNESVLIDKTVFDKYNDLPLCEQNLVLHSGSRMLCLAACVLAISVFFAYLICCI